MLEEEISNLKKISSWLIENLAKSTEDRVTNITDLARKKKDRCHGLSPWSDPKGPDPGIRNVSSNKTTRDRKGGKDSPRGDRAARRRKRRKTLSDAKDTIAQIIDKPVEESIKLFRRIKNITPILMLLDKTIEVEDSDRFKRCRAIVESVFDSNDRVETLGSWVAKVGDENEAVSLAAEAMEQAIEDREMYNEDLKHKLIWIERSDPCSNVVEYIVLGTTNEDRPQFSRSVVKEWKYNSNIL